MDNKGGKNQRSVKSHLSAVFSLQTQARNSNKLPPHWPSGYGCHLKSDRPRFDYFCLSGDAFWSNPTIDLKIGSPVATLPGKIGTALGLVSPVSAYCDLVR